MKRLEKRLLLASPTMHDEELAFIHEAFERNWVAPLGFNCDGFEDEMNTYLGGGCFNFTTVSGTSAIHLAVKLAGVKPGDIVGAIAGEAGVSGSVVGAIDIKESYSFVDVDRRNAEKVMRAMMNAKIRGLTVHMEKATGEK